LLGVVVCFIWAGGLGYLMFMILKKTVGLRVSPDEERNGINLYHVIDDMKEDIDEEELKKLLAELE
jgi:Amt family ammonium transporter